MSNTKCEVSIRALKETVEDWWGGWYIEPAHTKEVSSNIAEILIALEEQDYMFDLATGEWTKASLNDFEDFSDEYDDDEFSDLENSI